MNLDELLAIRKALFIGAHPDDIEFYCGGLVSIMRKHGIEVTFIIATRGGRGKAGRSKERLEAKRSQHAQDAARVLGGAKVILLDYPDTDLKSHIEPLKADLRPLIEQESPDVIFAWDPDFIYNPHPDHQAAANAAKEAFKGYKTIYYGTKNANLRVSLDPAYLSIKLAALRAHRTEVPWFYYPIVRRAVLKRLSREGHAADVRFAEGYRFIDS